MVLSEVCVRNPFKLLVLQIIAIPLVILVFRLPAEKQLLSLIANVIFLAISMVTIFYRGLYKNWIRFAGAQFLFLAVLPITVLRVLSWNGDFNNAMLMGVQGRQWHHYSNQSFLLMVLVTIGCFIRSSKRIKGGD